jgi:serine protease AprX
MRRIGLLFVALVVLALSAATPQGQRGPTLSDDVRAALARGVPARVIVQADAPALEALGGRLGRGARRRLANSLVLDVTPHELRQLITDGRAVHISGDLPVVADMAITNRVTGATDVWGGSSGLLGLVSSSGSTGRGIGVAVIDSGIADHPALTNRIVARVNFVSNEPGVYGDPFGHGTHVAGSIGGNGAAAARVTSAYSGGSAPDVHFVDVRVLGREGIGYTSDVIAGIDWTIANSRRYDIRVVNLSLGHPVAEPAATDPLCQAVARAVSAGLVVVVSAGNYGRTPDGAPVLGGITSPGNSPFAITVGALDVRGTLDTRDDRVAPYSSRGPTRYDFGVKPDLVAPGSSLVSSESHRSYISLTYPQFHVAGSGPNSYQRLSGTSMATGVVSGGVALLLDTNPALTPAQVKLALQLSARFDRGAGLIGAGAGSVNLADAERMARSGSLTRLLDGLLGDYAGPAFRDQGGSNGLIDRVYDGTGLRLLSLIDLDALWSSADEAEWSVLNLLGLAHPLAAVAPNYVVWGNVAGWSGSYYVVWGNTIQTPEGQYVVWGNSDVYSEYVVWSNGFVEEPRR